VKMLKMIDEVSVSLQFVMKMKMMAMISPR